MTDNDRSVGAVATYTIPAISADHTLKATFKSLTPTAPTNLVSTATAANTMHLTWTDNSSNETGFNIYQTMAADDCSKVTYPITTSGTVAANITAYDAGSLSANTRYCFKVTAANSAGESTAAYSQPKYTFIETPSGLNFSSVTATSMTASVGGTLSNLTAGSSGLSFQNSMTWTTINSANYSGLTCNTPFGWTVKARNGDGIETAVISPVTKYTLACDPTLTLTATANSIHLVVQPLGNISRSDTTFAVYGGTAGSPKYLNHNGTFQDQPDWQTASIWKSASGIDINNLSANTQYSFSVKARNGENIETAMSAPITVTTAIGTVPPPTLTTNPWDTTNGNSVSFQLSETDSAGISYAIACNSAGTNWLQNDSSCKATELDQTVALWTTHNILKNISADTTYTFFIRARGLSSSVTDSAPISVQSAPMAVTSMTHTGNTTSSIIWQWTPVGGTTTGYKIFDASGGTCSSTIIASIDSAATTSYTENNLLTNTQYSRCVRAVNSAGSLGQPSPVYSAYTSIETPSGITATPTANSIALSASGTLSNLTAAASVPNNYLSQFGSAGTGTGQFDEPAGVAVDSSGNIYVVDERHARVEKFDKNGVYQSQFSTLGSAGDGIALDSAGNIYVSLAGINDSVSKFSNSGTFLAQIGSAGSNNGQLNQVYGVAVDSSNNVYVVDTGNNRIEKFNSAGVYQSQIGSAGSGDGQFKTPIGVSLDSAGNIYVADRDNYRVQKFNSAGVFQMKFGSFGSSNGQFWQPMSVAVDSAGSIYVADGSKGNVQKFNSAGVYQSQFGSIGTNNGQFNYPTDLAFDSTGNIYITDTVNNRVQEFSGSISAGSGVMWSINTSDSNGPGAGGIADKFGIWQSSPSVTDTGLSPNNHYSYTFQARNGDGDVTKVDAFSGYTNAAAPTISSIALGDASAQFTSLKINFTNGGNPANTTFAVYNVTDNTYIYADGSGPKYTPDYQTYDKWNNGSAIFSGAQHNAKYTFKIVALTTGNTLPSSDGTSAAVTSPATLAGAPILTAKAGYLGSYQEGDYGPDHTSDYNAGKYSIDVKVGPNGNNDPTTYVPYISTDNVHFLTDLPAGYSTIATPLPGQIGTKFKDNYTFYTQGDGTPLVPNTQYYIKFIALNSDGVANNNTPALASAVTLPAAPTVSVSNSCSDTATVSWPKVDGAISYILTYGTSQNDRAYSTPTVIKDISGTSQTLTGLTDKTLYYVNVQSASASGEGGVSSYPYSLTQQFTTATCTVQAPTDFKGDTSTTSGTTSINWSWSNAFTKQTGYNSDGSIIKQVAALTTDTNTQIAASTDSGNGYKLYDSSDKLITTLPSDATSYTEAGLSANTAYTRYVVAYTTDATAKSNVMTKYTLVNPPTAPIVDSSNSTTLLIKIDTTDLNPTAVTRYAIYNQTLGQYVKQDGKLNGTTPDWQLYSDWHDANNNAGAVTEINLTPDTSYTYQVIAENGDNVATDLNSAPSATGKTYPKLNVTASTDGNGTVSPTGTTSYENGNNVNYTIAANTGYAISDVTDNDRSVGAVAAYSIPAISADHTIKASFVVVAPVAPTNLNAAAAATDKIHLTWTAGSSATGYNIYQAAGADDCSTVTYPTSATGTAAADATSYDAGSLSTNTRYCFKLTAQNSAGESTPIYSAPKYTFIETPAGINFSNITTTTITASASGTLSNLTASTSGISIQNPIDGTWGAWNSSNTSNYSSLSCNGSYNFSAKARNGDGVETSATSAVTKYTSACDPTLNLTATDKSIHLTINLNGNPSTTSFAVYGGALGSAKYLNHSGASQDQPDWQSYDVWGGVNGIDINNIGHNNGITTNTQYSFSVKARNGENVETNISPAVTVNTAIGTISAPIVTSNSWDATNGNSILFQISEADAPGVSYAISCNRIGTSWVQNDGSCGTTMLNQSSVLWSQHNLLKNLPTDYPYTFFVRAIGLSSNADSASVTVYTAPYIVTAMTHTSNTTSSITWSWASVGSASSYKIFDATGGVCSATLISSVDAESYTENNLLPNTQYSRCVRATNAAGLLGQPSPVSSAYTSIEAPTGIIFGTITSNSTVLSAAGTISNLNSGKSGLYFTTTSTNGGNNQFNTWTQTNSVTDSSFGPNTSYTYTVKARNGDGEETAATAGVSKYTLAVAPSVNPVAFGSNPNQLTITFTRNGNPTNTLYAVQNATDNSYIYADGSGRKSMPDWQSFGVWSTSTWQNAVVTDSGLKANVNYSYKVIAENGENITTESALASKTTQAKPPVISATASYSDADNYNIKLTIDGSVNQNLDKITYLPYWSTDNINFTFALPSSQSIPGTATSYNFNQKADSTSLLPNTQYYLKLIPQNSDNIASDNSPAIASAVTPPAAPAVSITNCATTATISWPKVDGADKYNLSYGKDAANLDKSSNNISATSVDLNGLDNNTAYTYRVQAVSNQNGAGPWSSGTFTTSTCAIPAPTDFKGDTSGTSSIVWSWSDAFSAQTGYNSGLSGRKIAALSTDTGLQVAAADAAKGYKLYDSSDKLITTLPSDATSYTEVGLSANTAYTRYVVAYTTDATAKSNVMTKYTLVNPPTAPIVDSSNSTTLLIKIDTTDLNPTAVTRYAIYNQTLGQYVKQDGKLNGTTPDWQLYSDWHDASGNAGAVTEIDLTPDTTYTYQVIAENGDLVATDLKSAPTITGKTNAEYKVTASTDGNGTISPSGDTTYENGNNIDYTISANSGYKIADVTDNDKSVGAVATYQIKNILAGHTIKATFALLAPTAPDNLTTAEIKSDSFKVSWKNQAVVEKGFNVYLAAAPTGDCKSVTKYDDPKTAAADATDYTFTGLTADTRYCAQVTATNDSGESTPAYITPVDTAPVAPDAPDVSAISDSQINVALKAGQNPADTLFTIYQETAPSGYINHSTGAIQASPDGQTLNIWTTSFKLSGLTGDTDYSFDVVAVGKDGTSIVKSASNHARTLAAVPAIAQVSGSSESSNKIVINPNNNSNSVRYAVASIAADGTTAGYVQQGSHKITAAEDWQTLSSWQGSLGYLVNDGLSIDTIYNYAVKAINSDGKETAISATVSARTFVKTPNKPALVANSWSQADGNSVTLTIDANGNPDSTLYAISCDATGTKWFTGSGDCGAQTWKTKADWENHQNVIKNLPADSDFSAFVIARSSDKIQTGNSETATAKTAPAAATTMTHGDNTTSSITWRWSLVAGSTAGYKILDATNGTCSSTAVGTVSGASTASYTENNLSANTQYSRCVSAVNSAGSLGQPSPVYAAYTSIETPGGIDFSNVTDYSLTLSAGGLSNLASGQSGLYFNYVDDNGSILYGGTGVGNDYIGTGDQGFQKWQSSSTITDTLTAPNHPFKYSVQARNGDGEVTPVVTSSVVYTLASAPVLKPLDPVNPPNQLNISFTNGGNPTGTLYAVQNVTDNSYLYTDGSGRKSTLDWQTFDKWSRRSRVNDPDPALVADSGLQSNATYSYKIIAKNADGVTSESAVASGTTQVKLPVLSATAGYSDTDGYYIKVTLGATDNQNIDKVSYTPYLRKDITPCTSIMCQFGTLHTVVPGTATDFTINQDWEYINRHLSGYKPNPGSEQLSPNTQYHVMLEPNQGYFDDKRMDTVSVVTPPAVPADVSTANVCAATATISWSKVDGADKYNLAYGKDAANLDKSSNDLTSTNITLDRLDNDTSYSYKVQAISNQNGAGPWSAVKTFSTATCTVAAPTVLTGKAVSPTEIDWNWKNNDTNAKGLHLYLDNGAAVNLTADVTSYPQTDLTANTKHQAKVEAYTVDTAIATASTEVYTLANTPSSPIVTPSNSTTLLIQINSDDSNPKLTTHYAIYNQTLGQYVKQSGTLNGTTPDWQYFNDWQSGTNTGALTEIDLTPDTLYTYKVIAQNGDNVATDLNSAPTASNKTYPMRKVSATTDGNGTITPAGDTTYENGNTVTYTIAAKEGYKIDSLIVDGKILTATATYTFANISADHTIKAVFALLVPKAPSELVATATATDKINLTWVDNSNFETGFNIYKAAGIDDCSTIPATNYSIAGAADANASNYEAGSLSANTRYCFKVTAKNDAGESAAIYTAPKYSLIEAPTINFDAISNDVITLSTRVSNLSAGASGLKFTSADTAAKFNDWIKLSQVVDPGLSADTSYTYSVQARNGDGIATAVSPAITKYTLANTPALTLTPSANSVHLTINLNNNSAKTRIAVKGGLSSAAKYLNHDGTTQDQPDWQVYDAWKGSNGIDINNLTANTQYSYTVMAENGDGTPTEISATTSVITSIGSVVPPVITVNSWDAVNGDSANFKLTETDAPGLTYGLSCNNDGSNWIQSDGSCAAGRFDQTVTFWSQHNLIKNLSAGMAYTFFVRAYGLATPADSDSIVIATAPAAVTALSHSGNTTSSITWNWPAVTGVASGYKIYSVVAGVCSATEITSIDSASTTSYTEDNLPTNAQSSRCVRATNAVGLLGQPSPIFSAYTSIETPTGINFDNIGTNSITLSATGAISNLNAGQSGLIFSETLGNAGGKDRIVGGKQSAAQVSDNNLTIDQQYGYKVKALNGDGEETADSVTEETFTTIFAPVAPTVVVKSATEISLQINKDNNPNTTRYAIFDSTLNQYVQYGSHTLSGTADWQNSDKWNQGGGFIVAGLSPDTSHQFAVKAIGQNGPETALVQAPAIFTFATTPGLPKIEKIDSTSLKITLNPGANPTERTEFAIFNETTGKYLTSTGLASATDPEWHLLSGWKDTGAADGVITNINLASGSDNSYKVIARNGDKVSSEWSVSASNATYPQYSVNIKTDGNGAGDLSKSTQSINRGSGFEVTASPQISSEFIKWDGCDTVVNNLCQISNISADRTVTATFTLKKFTVTVSKTGEGDADLSQVTEDVDYGSDLHIIATAKDSSNFVRWDGCNSTDKTTCYLSNITENKTVAAVSDLKQNTLNIKAVGCGSGGPTPMTVKYGGSSEQIFFAPDSGCELVQVAEGDQIWQPASNSYIATNVTSSHDVVGTFLKPELSAGDSGFDSDRGYYTKLSINPAQNPAETLYAVYDKTLGQYVRQADGVGIETADWQIIDKWGGPSGFSAFGLKPASTYEFEVKAKLPTSKETDYSPLVTSAATPQGPDGLFTINNNNDRTNQPTINIDASGNAVAAKVEVSNTADMIDAKTMTVDELKTWQLADNQSEGDKTIYLKFVDNFGNESKIYSEVIHYDLTPPSVPENITSVAGKDSISLAWSPSKADDVAETIIYRSTNQDFNPTPANSTTTATDYTQVADLSADSGNTFFDNNDIKSGLTYYYKIVEIDSAGNRSVTSIPVSAKPDNTKPTAPANISVKDNSVKVNNVIYTNKLDTEIDFEAASDDAGIAGYTAKIASESGSDTTQNVVTTENKLIYKFPSDGRYYLRISAKDTTGNESSDSIEQEVIVDTVAPVLPDGSIKFETVKPNIATKPVSRVDNSQIFALVAKAEAADQNGSGAVGVKIKWPQPVETGSGVAGYIVYRNGQPILTGTDKFTSNIIELPDNMLSYFDMTPIDKDVKYSLKVIDLAGNESPLYEATFVGEQAVGTAEQTQVSQVSAAPKEETAQNSAKQTSASVAINWRTAMPTTTQIEWGQSDAYGNITTLDNNFTYDHSVNLSGLTHNKTYHYRIIAYDKDGNKYISGDYTFSTTFQGDFKAIGVDNSGQPVVLGISAKQAVPATTAASAVIATASAAAAPLSNAATLFSLPEYLQSTIFSIVSFVTRRRRKNQGKVVEKETGLPIPQVCLRLISLEKDVAGQLNTRRVVATAYSDKSGGFNFIAEPGRYIIEVNKDMYTHIMTPGFYAPDSVITVKSVDEGLIVPIIALSMTKNQSPAKLKFIGRMHIVEKWLVYVSFLFLVFGTVSAVNALIHHTKDIVPIVSLVVFPLLWYLNIKSIIRVAPFGDVIDRENHEGVALALVRITDEGGQHLIRTTVTNEKGKFKTVVPKGRYKIIAAKPGYQQKHEVNLVIEEALDVVKKKVELDKIKLS